MSSGVFTRAKYQLDNGEVVKCRVQPETIAFTSDGVANAQPITPVTIPGSARMSSSQKRKGVNARTIRIRLNAAPDEYAENSTLTIPVLIKANWDGYVEDDTCTYLGQAGVIVGKSPEGVK